MVRLLAFALHANEYLEFGQGMTSDDDADLWQKDLTGAIELWIDVGLPDERLIRKACGRSNQVIVYTYGGKIADMWYEQNRAQLERLKNLTVVNLPAESTNIISKLAQRTMQFQFSIQDGQIWISDGEESVELKRILLKSPVSF